MTEMTKEEFQQFNLEFRKALRPRIVEIRKNIPTPNGDEYSVRKMADALGIKENTYRGYESEKKPRNNLPMSLLQRFCEISGHDPWTVLTGQGAAFSPSKRKTR